MSNERKSAGRQRANALPLVEQIAHLDAFLDQLGANRRPAPRRLTLQEVSERILAVQLRLAREGVEAPSPQFLTGLERAIERAVAQEQRQHQHRGFSRGHVMSTAIRAATAAGLVGTGVAADMVGRHLQPRMALVAEPGHWYDIAAEHELASGQLKRFAAGGVLGFLVNEGGRLHAVSAICTHMGCRLKSEQSHQVLRCLCHGARFSADGRVLAGPALEPLPRIDVRVEGGRVYARGTKDV
jgi:cytochrome b6-f complex iron-sulfur subunit